MINACINTSTIPKIFKLSRITPISKPQKPLDDIGSYRPLNNLPTLEKLLEDHILTHLNNHINKNNIIHMNHHGGRKGYSTTSALLHINNELNKNYESNKISATLATDLSSAFETIDHCLLIKKLEHYGVRGKERYIISKLPCR